MRTWTREESYYVAERAYRLYCEGRVDEAAILFEGLSAMDPDDAYCRKALAAIHIHLGQDEAALRELNVILARDRFHAGALAARCELLIARREFAAARRDLDRLSTLPGEAAEAGRLRLRLQHQSESILSAANPQLPDSPQR